MADRIKLLPEFVANQIAAGEVVNRPSSVVKEMIENAVDAGALSITVNFRDGGKELIQIVDDGCGMSPIDARLAFDRHATSKISQVDDIYALNTFGFRGEALASIASVAEVELRTRQRDSELGTAVEIAGGKFIAQNSVNTTVGSQFMVRNLFYNVPARRRFLEKSSTEARHITAEYQRVALCNPDIAFSLYDNDALVSKLPPSGLRQRIVGVIGKNIAKKLLDVETETSIVKVTGFAGSPDSARQTNKEQFLFVNGRYFKSPYFHKAVVSAYEKLIPSGTQPSYFIYLTLDPGRIDVNVHPQKTEVKFTDGLEIWQIINAAVRESLAKSGAVPPMDFDMDTSFEIPVARDHATYKMPGITANPDFNPFTKYAGDEPKGRASCAGLSDFMDASSSHGMRSHGDYGGVLSPEMSEEEYRSSMLEYIDGDDAEQTVMELGALSGVKDIMPFGQRYFAASMNGMLVVVDRHRAWEAVLYDRYLSMLRNDTSVTQQLLFPQRLTLSSDDINILRENMADFTAFGFDISVPDEHTVQIAGLPADLTDEDTEGIIYDILDAVREGGRSAGDMKKERLAAAMARIGSRAKGTNPGREELEALMEQLSACPDYSYTPSGLAVMTVFTDEDIKKRLK